MEGFPHIFHSDSPVRKTITHDCVMVTKAIFKQDSSLKLYAFYPIKIKLKYDICLEFMVLKFWTSHIPARKCVSKVFIIEAGVTAHKSDFCYARIENLRPDPQNPSKMPSGHGDSPAVLALEWGDSKLDSKA